MAFFRQNTLILVAYILIPVGILALEYITAGASLLWTMLFFVAISQGPIAVLAATEIAGSGWARPYKRAMLSVRHMIPMTGILFLVFALTGKVEELYLWTEHPNAWLDTTFFTARNVLLPILAWMVAGKYAKESLGEGSKKTMWALFWVFTYVIGQSIVAFDWVMSLEYPWISTLFGAYFFVEAFYGGLAFAAIFTAFRYQDFLDAYEPKLFKKSFMDMMTLMFGFSIFWAYQFFSQYIVIWYGNIPEEVAWFTKRLDVFGLPLMLAVLGILFVIPFVVLLSRKVKANPALVRIVGLVIWAGLMLERVIFLGPYHHFTINPVVAGLEFIAVGLLFIWVVRSDTKTLTSAEPA